jgi:cell wall assembly regulator SMI1
VGKSWESAVRAVLRELAEKIAAEAPRGWKRAELHGYAVLGGSGHRGFRFEPDELNEYGANDIDVFDGLRQLHTLMEASDHLTIELELESRGRFHAVLSERLDRTDDRGFRYLLDRDSMPPEPGQPRAASGAPEAGDPDEAVALLSDYLRCLGDILGPEARPNLPPPFPEQSRREIAFDLGVRLPRDLLALYGVADGDGGRGLLHGYGWFGLDMVAELCDPQERWWVTRGWRRYVYQPFITEFGPPLTIRRLSDHPAWIPFATDMTGNYLAVDMAPGPHGRPGQVILIGRDHEDGPTYVADSVTALLRSQVNALTSGSFERGDDGLWIQAGDPEHHKRVYRETSTLEAIGPAAAPVRALRPEVRELTVRNAPWVDLGRVRGAPALWRVSTENCPGADLAPLRDTPVEVLDLDMATIELADLAGHPTLRRVVLHSEKPVDLRPLLSCPALFALDVADAAEADVSVLGEGIGLRQLRMRRAHWDVLRLNKAIPASLAVAELAEEPLTERKLFWSFDKAHKPRRPTLKDAIDWAENLTGDACDIRTFTGRFATRRSH